MAAVDGAERDGCNLLKVRQHLRLARATVQLQDVRITEAEDGVALAEIQHDRAMEFCMARASNRFDPGTVTDILVTTDCTALGSYAFLATSGKSSPRAKLEHLCFREQGSSRKVGGGATTIDGIISTRWATPARGCR